MPLPLPDCARKAAHQRSITVRAYARTDGLWDVEGQLIDAWPEPVPRADGMLAAGELAVAMGLWSTAEQERQRALVSKAGLPLTLPALDPEAVLRTLQSDKKVRDGKVRFVLPTAIGSVVIRDDVEPDLIRRVLAQLS
jgi:hypothetical protein